MIQMEDISQICLGLGVVLFLTGCVMFFVLDVYKAWTILTGRQRKKNTEIEGKNTPTEEILKIKEQMEQAKISSEKTEKPRKPEVKKTTKVLGMDEGEKTTKVLGMDEGEKTTKVLGMDEGEKPTEVLRMDEGEKPTEVLKIDEGEEPTVVLTQLYEENVQDFQIVQEILFIS